ncbi:MAG: hypothetical protein M0C28_02585 [Candidatus Moduliflexus flocculans]|nr:hypothetical protein [Candidatus Moduliflexus flocculans]
MNRKIGLVERATRAPLAARIGLHALPPRLPGRPDEGRGGRLPDGPPGLRLPRPAPLRRRARDQRHGRLGHGLLQRLQPQVPVLPELPAQLAPRGHAGDGRGARGHDARSPGPGRPQHQPRLARATSSCPFSGPCGSPWPKASRSRSSGIPTATTASTPSGPSRASSTSTCPT